MGSRVDSWERVRRMNGHVVHIVRFCRGAALHGHEPVPRGVAAKLILLLHELAAHREPVGVTLLSRRTRLPKTTVHRLLADLEAGGVVDRSGRRYASPRPPRGATAARTAKPAAAPRTRRGCGRCSSPSCSSCTRAPAMW
ncbi:MULTISPECIES: helix-turn-helix domain-containing protein [Glycomyces]|uniref:helix-turn-helix domain-containing protein n=1 Tax=Glycomyces TaxID=58113 RepID=UPI0031DB7B9D